MLVGIHPLSLLIPGGMAWKRAGSNSRPAKTHCCAIAPAENQTGVAEPSSVDQEMYAHFRFQGGGLG